MKCPVCKSDDLITEVGGLNQIFKCKKCEYSGSFILEDDEEVTV